MTRKERINYYGYLIVKDSPLTDKEYDFIVNDMTPWSPFNIEDKKYTQEMWVKDHCPEWLEAKENAHASGTTSY